MPADAEMILEGYLHEHGYSEPEGPFGEYMGYYGPMHMDPVFHCTAITMRADALYHTWLHGSGHILDRVDGAGMFDLRAEGIIRDALAGVIRAHDTIALYSTPGVPGEWRLSFKQTKPPKVRYAIHTIFGKLPYCKHLWVYDDDIDITDDRQCGWAMGTRFQAHQDIIILDNMHGQRVDNSLDGQPVGSKAAFDCTVRFDRTDTVMLHPSKAKTFSRAPARYQTAGQALEETGPLLFAEVMEALGSDDGREVALALDALRQDGRLGRDRFGKYHLGSYPKGQTGIVGELDHDPND